MALSKPRTDTDHRIDLAAIARGTAIALAVAVPAVVVQNLADRGALRSLAFVVSLAGFALGGHRAAARRPRRGLTHGGLAGLAAGLIVLVIGIVRRTAAGEPVAWASQPLLALLAFSCGALGGYVAFRGAARGPEVDT